MSDLGLNDKNESETNKGFYNTLKNYANKAETDKLNKQAKEAKKDADKGVK